MCLYTEVYFGILRYKLLLAKDNKNSQYYLSEQLAHYFIFCVYRSELEIWFLAKKKLSRL